MVKLYVFGCFVLLSLVHVHAASVPNGGFERMDNSEQPHAWRALTDTMQVAFDQSVKYKGKASGRVRVAGSRKPIGMVSETISVQAGQTYNIRAFIKFDRGAERRAFVRVHWFDADLKPLDWALGTSSWSLGGEDWIEVAGTVVAPIGAHYAKISCLAEDWGEVFEAFDVWFDDVSFVKLSDVLPGKIVISAKPISDKQQAHVLISVADSAGVPAVDGTVVVLHSEVGKRSLWQSCKNGQANFIFDVDDMPVGGAVVWAQSGDAFAQDVLRDVRSGRVVGRIFDADTQRDTYASVLVQDSLFQTVLRRPFLGAFEIFVPQGTWHITADAGPTRISPALSQVVVVGGDSAVVDLPIRPWVDLEARGWVAGDLNVRASMGKLDRLLSVDQVVLTARAAGLNWALFTNFWDTTLRQYRPQDLDFGDAKFYGLWGKFYESARGDVWAVGDAAYDAPDMFGAQVLVHQDRGIVGHTRLFTPLRHTSRIIVDALSGPTFDCLDIMSEQPDDTRAQKLWFDLLNRGYRIAATASSRAVLDDVDGFLPGDHRTYIQVDGDVTVGRLTQALAEGQSFVSSGPLLLFSAFAAGPGSDLPVGRKRRATIRAWAPADLDDYLTRVELIRNGEIAQVWDLTDQPRSYKQAVTLQDSVDCWYIAKCYGADSLQVALTNPIYFRSSDFTSPEPVQAMVRGEIQTDDGQPVGEAQVLVKNALGDVILKTIARAGQFQLWASPTSLIEVQATGYKGMQQRIFDNTQLVDLLDQLQDVNYPPDTLSAPKTFERITKSLKNIEMLFVLNQE